MSRFKAQDFRNGSLIPSVIQGKVDSSISSLLKTDTPKFGGGMYKRKPSFLMCPPAYLSTAIANNKFMKGQTVDTERAMRQYSRIKRLITGLGVKIVELPPTKGCQDQHFVANIGLSVDPFIFLAKMTADGRTCEEEPARKFFEKLGYTVLQPPYGWEGEAETKMWKDKTYFGGYGKFSDWKAQEWISNKAGVEIIPMKMVSDDLYHLDCCIYVIDAENLLVCRDGIDRESFKRLEKLANVIVVPNEYQATGATNLIKIPDKNIVISGMFQPEYEKYRQSMEWMLTLMDKFNTSVIFMDIDEADKNGADCSCQVMHLTF
jgi:N-dimethylarginine dimethylaminohydrolase